MSAVPRRPFSGRGVLCRGRSALEAGVESWKLSGVDAFRGDDVGDAVVAEIDSPAVGVGVVAGFDDAVVVGADECQILKRGVAACPPGDEVVGVAADGWGVAAGEDASGVSLFEGCADGWGDEALGASDVQDVGGSAEDHGEQVGVTQQLTEH